MGGTVDRHLNDTERDARVGYAREYTIYGHTNYRLFMVYPVFVISACFKVNNFIFVSNYPSRHTVSFCSRDHINSEYKARSLELARAREDQKDEDGLVHKHITL